MRASSESARRFGATDAGVIDKNVNAAEPTQCFGRIASPASRSVMLFIKHGLTEPPGSGFHIGVDIDQQRTGPFRRQTFRDRLSNSPCCASDDGDLSKESSRPSRQNTLLTSVFKTRFYRSASRYFYS